MLKCTFHLHCLAKWCRNDKSCPNCRLGVLFMQRQLYINLQIARSIRDKAVFSFCKKPKQYFSDVSEKQYLHKQHYKALKLFLFGE